MFVLVRMCVCVCECVCVRTHTHTHARTHARTRARAHTHTHAQVDIVSTGTRSGGKVQFMMFYLSQSMAGGVSAVGAVGVGRGAMGFKTAPLSPWAGTSHHIAGASSNVSSNALGVSGLFLGGAAAIALAQRFPLLEGLDAGLLTKLVDSMTLVSLVVKATVRPVETPQLRS